MEYYTSIEEIDRAYDLRMAREETRFEFVLGLLELEEPIEKIVKLTKLSKEEILAIAQEMKKS